VTLTVLYFLAGLALLQHATAPAADGSTTNSGMPAAADPTNPVSQQGATSGVQPLPWPRWQRGYLLGLVPLEAYCAFGHRLLCGAVFGDGGRLPFLPLLLTSVYCAVGLVAAWLKMTARYMRQLLAEETHRHQD
jgi:hypothetical protein